MTIICILLHCTFSQFLKISHQKDRSSWFLKDWIQLLQFWWMASKLASQKTCSTDISSMLRGLSRLVRTLLKYASPQQCCMLKDRLKSLHTVYPHSVQFVYNVESVMAILSEKSNAPLVGWVARSYFLVLTAGNVSLDVDFKQKGRVEGEYFPFVRAVGIFVCTTISCI